MSKQTLIELAKDAPLPAITGAKLLGFAVSDLILYLTLVWALWRIVDGALTTYWKWQDRRKAKKLEAEHGSNE